MSGPMITCPNCKTKMAGNSVAGISYASNIGAGCLRRSK